MTDHNFGGDGDFERLRRAKTIHDHAEQIAGQVEFVPDAQPSDIDDISLGIFFIMAFWSGPSHQSFHHLVEAVAKHDTEKRLRVVVADTDCIPQFWETAPYDSELGGWGETYWVRNGIIVSQTGPGLNIECITPNTIALLERN